MEIVLAACSRALRVEKQKTETKIQNKKVLCERYVEIARPYEIVGSDAIQISTSPPPKKKEHVGP